MRSVRSMVAWMVAVALAGAPAFARAQANTPVVAVPYFDNNSFGKDRADYDGLGKGIADLLITDMASNLTMRVVERDRIQSILQEQNLVATKSVDPQTAVRLGKLLGAQYMVTGGFMSDGKGRLLVRSRVIDVETGAITNPMKLQSRGDDVLGLIGQLSTKLNADLHLAARPRKTALLYSKALDEQDSGHAERAAELYRAVLDKFPEFGPARQNLAKVQKSGD